MAISRPPTINGTPVPYGTAVEELKQRLSEPGPEAWAAFAALGDTAGPDALRLLRDYARSADWRYRRLAVEAINSHTLALEAADVLINALTDLSIYVVITGCRSVADHHLLQAHGPLISLLSHPEASVREAAVKALADLWELQDYEGVKRLHTSDASSEVRKEAARTLVLSATTSTWQDLYDLWRESPVSRYRLWAVKLARHFGGEEAIQRLEGFQHDPDGHVRKAAVLTYMARNQ